jgi:hypothetical protein
MPNRIIDNPLLYFGFFGPNCILPYMPTPCDSNLQVVAILGRTAALCIVIHWPSQAAIDA